MELKGSKTEQNLIAALANESMASIRYYFFANTAKKDGYEQIADIFTETGDNEKAHAKIWAKELGIISNTENNLKTGIEGEADEWQNLYPEFEKVAREEGFIKIADLFKQVASVEKDHDERYQKLLQNVKNNKVFNKEKETIWICRNCGRVHVGNSAPETCPLCLHPQSYFEVKAENY